MQLPSKDVYRNSCQTAALEHRHNCIFVQDLPSRGVDDDRMRGQVAESALVQHPSGLISEMNVDRQYVRGSKKLLQLLTPVDVGRPIVLIWVVGNHVHPKCRPVARHVSRHPAKPEQPQSHPPQIASPEQIPLPTSLDHMLVGPWDLPDEREQETPSVLRGSRYVLQDIGVVPETEDLYVPLGRSNRIDVVEPCCGSHHPSCPTGIEDLGIDHVPEPHEENVGPCDSTEQLVSRERAERHLASGLEHLEGFVRELAWFDHEDLPSLLLLCHAPIVSCRRRRTSGRRNNYAGLLVFTIGGRPPRGVIA